MTAASATLRVTRINQWISRFRRFRILLNGDVIGQVRNASVAEFEIAPGQHDLQVKIDWVASDPVTFVAEPGQIIEFECGHPAPNSMFGFRSVVNSLFLRSAESR
jgi:hypothetical protein